MTRHEKRFGISSFIYCSRRPFHPGRLDELFLEPFFVIPDFDEDVANPKRSVMEKERILRELQLEASEKQKKRKQLLGDLLRSKGFIWVATSHRQVLYQNRPKGFVLNNKMSFAASWAGGSRQVT